jgi:hypothetical protein
MTGLPDTPELRLVARRTMWFERPEDALADTVRFVAYVLTYGTHADVKVLRNHLDDNALRRAIDRAPAGIFDPRSWAYWNLRMGRYPAPPMPTRRL